MKTGRLGWTARADVVARLIAATGGSYGVAMLVAIACAWALPGSRIDAAAFGTIAALLVLPFVAMGCFWADTALRAWTGILICAASCAAIALAAGWRP